jgi:hypothetical protein
VRGLRKNTKEQYQGGKMSEKVEEQHLLREVPKDTQEQLPGEKGKKGMRTASAA